MKESLIFVNYISLIHTINFRKKCIFLSSFNWLTYSVSFRCMIPWFNNSTCRAVLITVSVLLIPHYLLHPPLTHLLSGNHQFVFYSSVSGFCLSLFFFVLFLKFRIWVKSHGICFSMTDLFHWAFYSLDPSMVLHLARFHYFLMAQ